MSFPEQIVESFPAETNAAGFITSVIASEFTPQGPAGSFVVRVKVLLPAMLSRALGVYTAFLVKESGLKVPFPSVVQ